MIDNVKEPLINCSIGFVLFGIFFSLHGAFISVKNKDQRLGFEGGDGEDSSHWNSDTIMRETTTSHFYLGTVSKEDIVEAKQKSKVIEDMTRIKKWAIERVKE